VGWVLAFDAECGVKNLCRLNDVIERVKKKKAGNSLSPHIQMQYLIDSYK
jgi:hypothetical protein